MACNFVVNEKVRVGTDMVGKIVDINTATNGTTIEQRALIKTPGGMQAWYPVSELKKLTYQEKNGGVW